MLLFNQTKNHLKWSMGGQSFACEPWASLDLPDEIAEHCTKRGIPLGVAPVAPEHRAQVRVEDERKASDDSALLAMKDRAEAAEADARAARGELTQAKQDLSAARGESKRLADELEKRTGELSRCQADKKTAEELLDAEAKRATDAEAKAIKAEALLSETRKPKPEKRASAG